MKIFVGNFPLETTDDELRELFEKHGEVVSARIVRDKHSGESRGFAFVEMPTLAEALDAIKNLNDSDFGDRTLNVSGARPKPQASRGGYRSGGGHRRNDGRRRGGGSRKRSGRRGGGRGF